MEKDYKDYEELEGKIVDVINSSVEEHIQGHVVGIDYDIGITIVDANDHERYILCYTGPAAEKFSVVRDFAIYNQLFNYTKNAIERGVIDLDELFYFTQKISVSTGRNPSKETCPFGR